MKIQVLGNIDLINIEITRVTHSNQEIGVQVNLTICSQLCVHLHTNAFSEVRHSESKKFRVAGWIGYSWNHFLKSSTMYVTVRTNMVHDTYLIHLCIIHV